MFGEILLSTNDVAHFMGFESYSISYIKSKQITNQNLCLLGILFKF